MSIPTTNAKLDPAAAPTAVRPRFPAWLVAALLALATIILYWPATRCGFTNYDDPVYVTENLPVQSGLTVESVKWAFMNPVSANWHPVTMLSHMLDCQLFGLNPWGHHLTSLMLHALNTVLVFLLLRRLTGALWRSALVAALFGLHPLHVESVAWVAERKDVLSTLWWLLTLWAYANFAKAGNSKSKIWYAAALALFALGLMSKTMLVTLPCVLLLVDYWPLARFQPGRVRQLVVEKIPFFVLTVAASVMTVVVQRRGGAVITMEGCPPDARVGNAVVSYCRYLGKMFWPSDLAVFYPHPGYWPLENVLLAGAILCGISWLLFVRRGRHPYLLMGWLWFIGTLVPVIGVVQVGEQALADRYTYIPSLGVLIGLSWGAFELTRRWRHQAVVLWLAGAAAIILCWAVTRQQLAYWKDSETLFRHTLAVTENNPLAQNNLGLTVLNKGRINEAISHYQEAARLKPAAAEIHNNLGVAYLNNGQTDEAIRQFDEAIRLKPAFIDSHMNIGLALFKKGSNDEAISQFRKTVGLKPDFNEARINLGVALLKQGDNDEAVRQLQEALRFRPDDANARFNLGVAFFNSGRTDEAISQFQETLRLNPNDPDARSRLAGALELKSKSEVRTDDSTASLNNQAWKLATSPDAKMRDGALAVKLAERACEQTHYRETVLIGTLAAAYAEAGRFDAAILAGQKACARAAELGETNLLKINRELVALYQAHRPYHEPPASSEAAPIH